MCVDYTKLNKACPKDPFLLPRIYQVVNSMAGCDLLCFPDVYSGYHQISMTKENEEKTSFTTPVGTYYYIRIPFGLKNTNPMFQQTMHIILKDLQGHNIEEYVDNIVVKTRQQETRLRDLSESFDSLRTTRLKLNLEKCVFGVSAGKLLHFLVSSRGIKVNPQKVEAIDRMQPPTRLKEAQHFTRCMAALGRFISKLGERALSLFKLLKKTGRFEWTMEADQAFRGLKEYLSSASVLMAPRDKEELVAEPT
jgi:hypothetical protein